MNKYISEQSIYQYFGDDDPDMIRSMVNIILETNIIELQELPSLYKKGDLDTIKKRCHKAKPSMSYIGALQTKKILEEIESDIENSENLNSQLQENLEAIEVELQDFLEKL
jgi:HPt (histidine-containing phosphotransfer) domain-containing protein